MTQERTEALAERIAAALRERRRIGEERRLREYQGRNAERAIARYHRLRGEPKEAGHGIKELNAICEAVISSNAADEAMKAHGVMEVSEPLSSPGLDLAS
jgi:hypothetical protein